MADPPAGAGLAPSRRGRPSGGSLPESARLVATVLRYFGPSHYRTIQSAVGYLMEVEGRVRSERLADRNTDRGIKRLIQVGLAQHRKDGLYELVNPVSVVVEGFIRTLREYQNLTFERLPVQPDVPSSGVAVDHPGLPPSSEGRISPEVLREIVRLRDEEGRSWGEISAIVQVAIGRVRRAYARPDKPLPDPTRARRSPFEVKTYSPSLLRDWTKVESAWPETSEAVRMLLDDKEPEGLQIPGGLFLDRSPDDSRARLAYEILSAVGAFHRAKATSEEKRQYMAEVIQNRRALERTGGKGAEVPSFENPPEPTKTSRAQRAVGRGAPEGRDERTPAPQGPQTGLRPPSVRPRPPREGRSRRTRTRPAGRRAA